MSRLDFYKASPDAMKALMALEGASGKLGLDAELLDLVKLRASQLNGCAFCVDLHSADLRRRGDNDRRIAALPVWRESPFYTSRERAALAWTDALTLLPQTHAPDEDYAALEAEFSERERVDLSLAIGLVNVWNRLAVGFRKLPE